MPVRNYRITNGFNWHGLYTTTTDIEFIDIEKNKSYTASFSEIEKNDFILSVSAFVVEEKEQIQYNPIELQKNARNGMLKRIKADIELDKMICEMEGYCFNDYLNSIKDLVESYLKN